MGLPEFLLARYDEREATLRILLDSKITDELPELARGPVFFIEAHDDGLLGQSAAVRELFADLAAKRQIVELHGRREQGVGTTDDDVTYWPCCSICDAGDVSDLRSGEAWPCETQRLLAQPYIDHPDYRPEWRIEPAMPSVR